MKTFNTLLGTCCVCLAALLAGCGRRPAPLKEGVIWRVEWENASGSRGLHRAKIPANVNPALAGEYGGDMYGALYPGFLEVRRIGSRESPSQIIPLRQIIWLEFGDAGVSIDKP